MVRKEAAVARKGASLQVRRARQRPAAKTRWQRLAHYKTCANVGFVRNPPSSHPHPTEQTAVASTRPHVCTPALPAAHSRQCTSQQEHEVSACPPTRSQQTAPGPSRSQPPLCTRRRPVALAAHLPTLSWTPRRQPLVGPTHTACQLATQQRSPQQATMHSHHRVTLGNNLRALAMASTAIRRSPSTTSLAPPWPTKASLSLVAAACSSPSSSPAGSFPSSGGWPPSCMFAPSRRTPASAASGSPMSSCRLSASQSSSQSSSWWPREPSTRPPATDTTATEPAGQRQRPSRVSCLLPARQRCRVGAAA